MHFESMNDTLEPPIIAAESIRMVPNIANVRLHTVLEWRMSIVKQQSENFNWFYKLCFKFFQDCYCVIKKWKIMNSNLTHSLQNFRPKLDFEQQKGIFTSVERTIPRNSLYNLTTRWLDNQHWIATLVYFLEVGIMAFSCKCLLLGFKHFFY